MKRIRSLGIVLYENKTVLIHRNVNNEDYFVFPGGGVEEGETKEEAAIREVCEETGLEVRVEKLLYSVIDENSEHYFYACAYISGELKKETQEGLEVTTDSKIPAWYEVSMLNNMRILPLDVRDWLTKDLQEGFKEVPRTHTSLVIE